MADISDYPKPTSEKIVTKDGTEIEIPEYHSLARILWTIQNGVFTLAGRGDGDAAVLGGPLNMGNVVKGANSETPDDSEFLTYQKAKSYFAPSVMAGELSSKGSSPLNIQGLPGIARDSQIPLVQEYDPNLSGNYIPGTLVTVDGALQIVTQGSPTQVLTPVYAVPSEAVMKAAQSNFGPLAAGQATEVTVTWDTPFEDALYTPQGSVLDTSAVGAGLVFERFRSITEEAVIGVIWNGGGVPLSGTMYATAVHL